MSALNDVRQALGLWKISQLTKKPREAKIVPYVFTKKIAVLLMLKNRSDEDFALQVASAFIKEGKECTIFGFADIKASEAPKSNSLLLNRNDLQFNYIPKEQHINSFSQIRPDILIDLSTELCIPLAYFSAISKSGFKIGKYHPKLAGCYDFMLDSREATANGLFREIMHYLYTIK